MEARIAVLPADTDLSAGIPSPTTVPGNREVLSFVLQSPAGTSLFVAPVIQSHDGTSLGPLEEPLPDAMAFGSYADFFGNTIAEA
jgi:hypothetical protein